MNEIQAFFLKHQDFNAEEQEFFGTCHTYFAPDEVKLIERAYIAAKDLHQGQIRDSGEPYITHPLRVAKILLEEIGLIDVNSVVACLLHDTIEDTGITKEFLGEHFNPEVAELVDGVTRIKDWNLDSKEEKDLLNNAIMLRKILNNPKILLIKLADRLHNMRTLEYKKNPKKQEYKALETLSFFLPLADLIGLRKIKEELEERCFYFLSKPDYKNAESIGRDYILRNRDQLEVKRGEILEILRHHRIYATIEIKYLNIYQLFSGLKRRHKLKKIPNFVTFKIIASKREDCYEILKLIAENYGEVLDFKDYIKEPKVNNFRALSFYVNMESFRPIQFEVSTARMGLVNDYGYAGLFQICSNSDSKERIIENTSFMRILNEISNKYRRDKEFYEQVNKKLLVDFIKVYTPKRKMIWLPVGSTVKDFAYKIHTEVGNNAIGGIVNQMMVDLGFVLRDGDIVTVLTKDKNIKMNESYKRERKAV